MRTLIDDAIDRLIRAHEMAGLPPIRPAGDVAGVLGDIAAAIHPLRLPDDVVTFWLRVDPGSLTITPYAHPTDPAFALHCWREHRDSDPGAYPNLLFPVCYQSHSFISVELGDGSPSGGACYQWAYCDEAFVLRHTSFAQYIDALAEAIERGADTLRGKKWSSWYDFDPANEWERAQSKLIATAIAQGAYDREARIEMNVRNWPSHWLRAQGLTVADRTARGATTTVARLLATAQRGTQVKGTIKGAVVGLSMTGMGRNAQIDDGSGTLDIWCPNAVCAYGPVMGGSFEFDVVVRANPTPMPDVSFDHMEATRLALSGDMLGAQEAVMRMVSQTANATCPAEATAIRPLQ